MSAFVLRQFIAHWIAELDSVRVRAKIDAFMRAGKRRARERMIADLEAWGGFSGLSDDRTRNEVDDEPDY